VELTPIPCRPPPAQLTTLPSFTKSLAFISPLSPRYPLLAVEVFRQ
jgi:hypothetical protein